MKGLLKVWWLMVLALATGLPGAAWAGTGDGDADDDTAHGAVADREEDSTNFLKGELTSIGATQLVSVNDRVGARVGFEVIDGIYYLGLVPELDLHWETLHLGFGLPLKLEIFDATQGANLLALDFGDGFANAGSIRLEDFDEISDYARVIRYIRYGRKEDQFYLDINRLYGSTIGHGTIMRRYTANLNVNTAKVGVNFDAYWDFGGFQTQLSDITFPIQLIAAGIDADAVPPTGILSALVFVKPFGLFADKTFWQSISAGLTAAIDFNAPVTMQTETNAATGERVLSIDPDTLNPVVTEWGQLAATGLDLEMKIYKSERVDLKLYGDVSTLVWDLANISDRGGIGTAVGSLLRINYGDDDDIRAARIRIEGRRFDADYVPTYFDTFYEIQKYQYPFGAGAGAPPTKLANIAGRTGPARFGYYVEATWAVPEAIAIGIALEDATPIVVDGTEVRTERNFLAHLEVPYLEWLQFFVTYHKRGFDSFAELAQFSGNNTLLYTGARLQILPILFINAAYQQSFSFGRRTGDTVEGGLQTATNIAVDVEFGWEF